MILAGFTILRQEGRLDKARVSQDMVSGFF
jgi:hypothetical protein